MELTGRIHDLGIDFKTKMPKVTFLFDQRCMEEIEELAVLDKLKIKISKFTRKRSLDANAYFWVLCGKLAKKTMQDKNDVYKHLIKGIGGNYEVLPIRKDAVEKFKENWSTGRIGWFCEEIGNSKLEGYVNLIAYYGSSVYDSAQMSRLIDNVILACKEQGIQTETPEEIARMKALWRET